MNRSLRMEVKDSTQCLPFFRGRMGNVKGTIHITVACNVGNAHMPESTAVLTFWM